MGSDSQCFTFGLTVSHVRDARKHQDFNPGRSSFVHSNMMQEVDQRHQSGRSASSSTWWQGDEKEWKGLKGTRTSVYQPPTPRHSAAKFVGAGRRWRLCSSLL